MGQLAGQWRDKVVLAYIDEPPFGGYLGSPAHRRQMAQHGLSAREIDPVATTGDHASA
jgi:hypothetical protein